MIRNYENKLYNSFSKEKITYFKDKIRLEINKGREKDRILTPEDAVLFKKFLHKVNTELKNTN